MSSCRLRPPAGRHPPGRTQAEALEHDDPTSHPRRFQEQELRIQEQELRETRATTATRNKSYAKQELRETRATRATRQLRTETSATAHIQATARRPNEATGATADSAHQQAETLLVASSHK